METVQLGNVTVSRFIVGSNPFSGFSHLGTEMDDKMRRFFTAQQIKETLYEAERLGIRTMLGRTDHHVMRVLLEYWDEGGKLEWAAQTCPGVGPQEMCIDMAAGGRGKVCHIHGGHMDYLLAQERTAEVQPLIDLIRERGMPAGLAGHNVRVFQWAEENLDCDYYMCCYYNPSPRDERPEHVAGVVERYREEDRAAMVELIQGLSRPVIHYKIMAAGRNDPVEAFAYAARAMRPGDAVCVGIYQEQKPDMLAEDVRLLEESLAAAHGAAVAG